MQKNREVLDETSFDILRKVPDSSGQMSLAKELDISIGKVNYVLNALIDKGLIKVENFKNSNNKIAYRYLLTQKGVIEKFELTKYFIERKKLEYDELQKELEILSKKT
ncbi:MarR family EPS-associated transcriptional regulator [Aliarcobacter trophiarum]|uniref:EPS-associated transcriptional regulator, MarR family n=1 Tax=Aliarcobacter trophiarum LMG 25534 TaxID=1032241 RepID=A0AAD0VMB9_9BACT|nr:MarR family EPS-associated transcriptional regulator [Aliarcobacter trophiarum]AXK49293.1 EPS-associated transcriptional regulator, MarR family [Aliarcobacter trophiarum LMG 25534]